MHFDRGINDIFGDLIGSHLCSSLGVLGDLGVLLFWRHTNETLLIERFGGTVHA